MVKHVYYTTLGVSYREGGAGTLSNTYYSMDITEIQNIKYSCHCYNGNIMVIL